MCNLCSFIDIKRRAKERGLKVTTIQGWMGGTDVYVHPKTVNIKKLEGFNIPDHPNRDKYFVAWFREIPGSHVD